MKIIASAGGRFNAFYQIENLVKFGVLQKFYTTGYSHKLDKNKIPKNLVKNAPIFEYIGRAWKFLPAFVNERLAWNVVKDNLFDFWVKQELKKVNDFDLFVGWCNFSLHSIPVARSKGAKIVLESGSSHIQEQSDILQKEYAKFGVKFNPVHEKIRKKVLREYELADHIMVPSTFVYDSFLKHGIDSKKLIKVPYGVELDRFFINKKKSDKFRVIFVGMVGIRKGLYYLFKAWEKLNLPIDKTELLIVGNIQPEFKEVLNKFHPSFDRLRMRGRSRRTGRTGKWENIKFCDPSDRNELAKLYQSSSVFVHPSVEEGLSMVQAEAMASGLPLICTTNTGGSDLIEENKHGFVVPTCDVDALAEKILWCYQNQNECYEMGLRVQEKIKNQTWQNYGKNVFAEYKKILEK